MRHDATPADPPSVFPWAHTLELMDAGRSRDLRRIDAATDALVALKLCRPRTDASMFGTMRESKQNVWSNAS